MCGMKKKSNSKNKNTNFSVIKSCYIIKIFQQGDLTHNEPKPISSAISLPVFRSNHFPVWVPIIMTTSFQLFGLLADGLLQDCVQGIQKKLWSHIRIGQLNQLKEVLTSVGFDPIYSEKAPCFSLLVDVTVWNQSVCLDCKAERTNLCTPPPSTEDVAAPHSSWWPLLYILH